MERPPKTTSLAKFALYVWELEEQNKRLRKALERLVDNKWESNGYHQYTLAIRYAEKILEEEG